MEMYKDLIDSLIRVGESFAALTEDVKWDDNLAVLVRTLFDRLFVERVVGTYPSAAQMTAEAEVVGLPAWLIPILIPILKSLFEKLLAGKIKGA